jgi:hypothetical protein
MSELNGMRANEDIIPEIKEFEGVGELTVGGTVAGGDANRVIFTALSIANDPAVNSYLLANKVKLTDRVTKTKIFPREGMALPNGEIYHLPEEVTELPAEKQENA